MIHTLALVRDMYAGALGVKQDRRTALTWYLIAAANGSDAARDAAAALRRQISHGDAAAAEAAARAFKPSPAPSA